MGGGGVTRVLQAIGVPVMLSRVRRQRCATTGCANKSRMALTFPLSDIGEDGGPGIGAIVQCAACIEGAVVKVTDGGSRVRTYVLNLTEDELVAVFTECNCCSDRDAHESATGKAYRKLSQIGHFRRAEKERAEGQAAREAYQALRTARSREILSTPATAAEANELIRAERAASSAA